jgi:hypothetical protein
VPQTGTTRIKVDLAGFQAPSMRVFTNACAVIDGGLFLEFAFAYARPKGPSRPVLSVVVSAEAVVKQLWGTSVRFLETETNNMKEAGIKTQAVGDSIELGDVPVLQANLFRLTKSGTEGIMECYWLSPHWVVAAGIDPKRRPTFDPVVTVQMPSPVLIGMLEHVSKKVDDLRKRLGPMMPYVEPG